MLGGWTVGIIFLLPFCITDFNPLHGHTVCMMKNIFGIPCPSCGGTRSVLSIINGNFLQALLYNPFGYILLLLLLSPIWIILDLMNKTSGFYNFYKKTEHILRQRTVYYPLVLLILVNWLWNFYKYL